MINMKKLVIISTLLFIALLWATTTASYEESVFAAIKRIPNDKWFTATIIDFYNNQLLIFFWMVYKEKNPLTILTLFVLSICFGSFTSIGYLLYQLYKHKDIQQALIFSKRKSNEFNRFSA